MYNYKLHLPDVCDRRPVRFESMERAISLQGVKEKRVPCNKCRKSTERLVALEVWPTNQLIMTRHYCPHANGKVRNCSFEYLKYIPLPVFMYPGKGLCLENSTALSQTPDAQMSRSQVHEAPLNVSSGTGDCPVINPKGLQESTQLALQTRGSLSESHDATTEEENTNPANSLEWQSTPCL